MNFKQIKKQQGFTLIELMIVIAIIAILATLGVTNFASALRRARDAQRQSDIIEVQMALEVCYNARTGVYVSDATILNAGALPMGTASWNALVGYLQTRGCLNRPVEPANAAFGYFGAVGTNAGVQSFLLCASMEEWAGNRASVAPVTTPQTGRPANIPNLDTATLGGDGRWTVPALCDSTHTNCELFCIAASQ